MEQSPEYSGPESAPRDLIDRYLSTVFPFDVAKVRMAAHERGDTGWPDAFVEIFGFVHDFAEQEIPTGEDLAMLELDDIQRRVQLAIQLGIPVEYLDDLLLAYRQVKVAEDNEGVPHVQTRKRVNDRDALCVLPGYHGSRDPALVVCDVYNGLVTLARLTDSVFLLHSGAIAHLVDASSGYAPGDPTKPYED